MSSGDVANPSNSHETTFPAMGTFFNAAWKGAEIPGSVLCEETIRLENLVSHFRSDSVISRLDGTWRDIDADTARILTAAQQWRDNTQNWFNPLVGAHMRAWKQGSPRADALPQARVEIRSAKARLKGRFVANCVDLGGIAKGYAADFLADYIQNSGGTEVCVSAGMSSFALRGRSWSVGLSSPWKDCPELLGQIILPPGALSISADSGIQISSSTHLSHLLGLDGSPARTDLAEVVVIGADGLGCEALSSAILAGGKRRMDRFLSSPCARSYQALVCTGDGQIIATSGFPFRVSEFGEKVSSGSRFERAAEGLKLSGTGNPLKL